MSQKKWEREKPVEGKGGKERNEKERDGRKRKKSLEEKGKHRDGKDRKNGDTRKKNNENRKKDKVIKEMEGSREVGRRKDTTRAWRFGQGNDDEE